MVSEIWETGEIGEIRGNVREGRYNLLRVWLVAGIICC